MKHIKTFELYDNDHLKNVENAGWWMKLQLPSEHFFDWEYENTHWLDEYPHENEDIPYNFYYDEELPEEVSERIFKFFEKNNIECEFSYGKHDLAPDNLKQQEKYSVKLNREKIKEFAQKYEEINKYNL